MKDLASAVGTALRRARQRQKLTLHDIQRMTGGRFKASALGGYERGERMISLDRFCELASVYGVLADRLLSEVLGLVSPEGRSEVRLDPGRLPLLEEESRATIEEFVRKIQVLRGDYGAKAMTLRSGDIEAIALASGSRTQSLLRKMSRALVPGSASGSATTS